MRVGLGVHAMEVAAEKIDMSENTDLPAYSDTVYSDTPLTVTLLACPK